MALVLGLTAWSLVPAAIGTTASTDLQVSLTVPQAVSVVPGQTTGDTSVKLPDLTVPGVAADANSPGWRWMTNVPTGYEVRIRSVTDPALRGANAVGGGGSASTFQDFSTGASCPCPWTAEGFVRGVFGYSAQITNLSGAASATGSKWGTPGSLLWRGFDDSAYTLFDTPGGAGSYGATIYFRSVIPEGKSQPEGAYRANLIVSVHSKL